MRVSRKGTQWKTFGKEDDYFESRQSVSVGVFAESGGTDAFQVVFDQFKLTPLK